MNLSLKPTYAAPLLDPSHRLHTILDSALKNRGVQGQGFRKSPSTYWNAQHFGFHRVDLFKKASEQLQQETLCDASRTLLEEAYFIEKSGMSFTAKMVLLSETQEEKMLYSLFSADEAIHLQYVKSHLSEIPNPEDRSEFVDLLSDMICEGSRPSLVFLIQVVLEGWGITHYHELAENCIDPTVKESLRLILRDEARHHGSGMIMTRNSPMNGRDNDSTREVLIRFLQMVQCGPQGLVSVLERKLGHLTPSQKVNAFEQLESERNTAIKLNRLRELITQGGASHLLDDLEKAGVFRPFTAQECAQI